MFLPYFIWDCDNHVEISSLVYDGKVLHKTEQKKSHRLSAVSSEQQSKNIW